MVKKNKKNEIDIYDLINALWKNKWKIFLITATTVIITIFVKFSSKTEPILTTSTTEIIPISVFDSKKYAAYNSYLVNSEIESMKFISNIYVLTGETSDNRIPVRENWLFGKVNSENLLQNNFLDQIDGDYLQNLFIKKLNEKTIFKDGIKKFNLIKKSDYPDNIKFEKEVNLLASSIKIIDLFTLDEENTKKIKKNVGSSLAIQFQTYDRNSWKDVLKYAEKNANLEIKKFIKDNFELFIENAELEKKYLIEDIDFEIKNNSENKRLIIDLMKLKKKINQNKVISRLQNHFNQTPLMSPNNFKAATLAIESTQFQFKDNENNLSTKILAIQSVILGFLLGIFYVMIVHILPKRLA